MINKDSFYGVMTNRYEVNLFCFLCYTAELDSKHKVAGFRLLSLLCITLTWTFTGNSIQTIAHYGAFSLGYVEMCINPLSPLSRHKFSIEFDNRSKHFLLSDHFINSHNHFS